MAGQFAVAMLALVGASAAQAVAKDKNGCPANIKMKPSNAKPPGGCPEWSKAPGPAQANEKAMNWHKAPPVRGSEKDNECLIGGIVGGDFFNPCFAPDMASVASSMMKGGKDGGGMSKAKTDWSGGSGPYKAQYFQDPGLPKHTIYAPKVPTGKKMPVIAWANGACGVNGAGFSNFLTEIASHGFMVIANGAPKRKWGEGSSTPSMAGMGGSEEKSRAKWLMYGIDWAKSGAAGGKYGQVDMDQVGVAGQSCGGVEAYSQAVLDPRIKVIAIYNTGVIDPQRRHYLREIHRPVGYFYGGETDFSKKYIEDDFQNGIGASTPAMMSVLQTGHFGTFFEPNGGRYGRISVEWWKWQLMGDQAAKAKFFNTSSPLYQDKWNIRTWHWRDPAPPVPRRNHS